MRNLSMQSERRWSLSSSLLTAKGGDDDASARRRRRIADLCDIRTSSHAVPDRAILTSDGFLVRFRPSSKETIWVCNLNEVRDDEYDDDDDDDANNSNNNSSISKPPPTVDGWFSVYCTDAPTLICLNRNGTLVSVSPETAEEAQIVGSFDNGIEAAAWSPDGQVLLLVTFAAADDDDNDADGNNRHDSPQKSVLLALNDQWQVLAEVDMERHMPSTTTFATTNTTGSAADTATTTTFDTTVHLAWRPDATLCAVSSVDAADQIRKVRIYRGSGGHADTTTSSSSSSSTTSSLLQLHGLGRTEDGSGKLAPHLLGSGGLAWAGPGCSQLLACLQRKGMSKQQVAFMESNGLRHGEFTLRPTTLPNVVVVGLCWNRVADLLAISLRSGAGGTTNPVVPQDRVQLWHRSNYHWYLKREMCYAQRVGAVQFHPEQPYRLSVVLTAPDDDSEEWQEWIEYDWQWHAASVDPTSPCSTAFVVDGNQVNITPLDRAVVPPPMSASQLTLPETTSSCVNEIVFGRRRCSSSNSSSSNPSSMGDGALLLLSDGSLAILSSERCEGVGIGGWKPPSVVTTARLPNGCNIDPSSLRHLVVIASGYQTVRLIGACLTSSAVADPGERLVVFSVSWNAKGEASATVDDMLQVESPILAITPWADSPDGALVELEDGHFLEYENENGSLTPSAADPLLEPCPWIAAIKFPSELEHQQGRTERTRLVFGMSLRGRFYCHDLLLAESISSFCLSMAQQYVCYTSLESRCQLRCLPLTELASFDPLMGSDEHHHVHTGYEARNVERGARLVSISPYRPTAVLQMPRGNLEVVYPRALVLRCIMNKIMERQYKDAFEIMRRQKVDLNLIVDMDPDYFLNKSRGVIEFLDQVQSVDHLNLFISSLQNWNSTHERYPVPHWIREDISDSLTGQFDFTSKVNRVCQSMRSVMIQAERTGMAHNGREVSEGAFLLPILSSFAKQNPPKLVEALALIKDVAEGQHVATSKKPPLFSETAQSSIQYLAFLAEYELLFNEALGQYDYDMARAVARNSQMDPKLYLPLLKRYRELPPNYARYEVDMRLNRYESALRNLAQSYTNGESLEGVSIPSGQEVGSVGNSFEDCMLLIQRHGLHQLGLKLFQDSPSIIQRIMLSLGDRLMVEKKPSTALNVFLAAPSLDEERAMTSARAAKDWLVYFSLIRKTKGAPFDQEKQQLIAHDVAQEMAANAQGSPDQKWLLESAARILLDYGKDVDSAVDMLIRAEQWAEGQRTATLYSKENLSRKCLDAAVCYTQTTILDLEERSETFKVSMARYVVVRKLRKEAIASGEAEDIIDRDNDDDETGSLFSAASNASNSSVGSTASTGSVGSLSSVISAKSTSSFSLSGAGESYRHKSKFNQLGGGKKKKKKKKGKGRTKVRPGSQAELVGLVDTLQRTSVDESYRKTIAETIVFLSRNGHIALGRDLYSKYVCFGEQIASSQYEQREAAQQDLLAAEMKGRREGTGGYAPISLSFETQVSALACDALPECVTELFFFLPECAF